MEKENSENQAYNPKPPVGKSCNMDNDGMRVLPIHFVINHPSPSGTLYECINFSVFLVFHTQGLEYETIATTVVFFFFLKKNLLLHWPKASLAQGPPGTHDSKPASTSL